MVPDPLIQGGPVFGEHVNPAGRGKALREFTLDRMLRETEKIYRKVLGAGKGWSLRLLNRAPLAFRYRVIRDGLLLFCRDETLRVDFEARTFSQYFDFAPFQRAYLREVFGLGPFQGK